MKIGIFLIDKSSYKGYFSKIMKGVGIKNLKNNLSKYLKNVQEGEFLYVMDRDEIIAEIHRPTLPVLGQLSAWEAFLNHQARQGTLTRAKRKESRVIEDLKTSFRWPSECDLSSLLDEVRGDRL